MARFRMDNTEGYGQGDIDELNHAFDSCINAGGMDVADDKSWQDHIAEQLLSLYDAEPMTFRFAAASGWERPWPWEPADRA